MAPSVPEETHEHYIPHKPVVRDQAKSTKVQVVYDALTKVNEDSPSPNDCLDVGPSFQRMLSDILLRNRSKPVILAGSIKQAFLQIAIIENEKDALRLLQVNSLEGKEEKIYRKTRVMFCLGPSPFILHGTLNVHLEKYSKEYPICVRQLEEGTYADDINIEGDTVEKDTVEGDTVKKDAIDIFDNGGFKLHKWNSNVGELESSAEEDGETTYAKKILGTTTAGIKLLGLSWNKKKYSVSGISKQREWCYKKNSTQSFGKNVRSFGIGSSNSSHSQVIFRDIGDSKLKWMQFFYSR